MVVLGLKFIRGTLSGLSFIILKSFTVLPKLLLHGSLESEHHG
jgi:hypothetical protein